MKATARARRGMEIATGSPEMPAGDAAEKLRDPAFVAVVESICNDDAKSAPSWFETGKILCLLSDFLAKGGSAELRGKLSAQAYDAVAEYAVRFYGPHVLGRRLKI